jgi:ATP-binding cassette, subfamily A (ABC1), member 3
VEDASLLSDFGAELSYRLPGKDLKRFCDLFEEIDKSQHKLGIDSYGISLTTLEEVFLRIGMEETEVSLTKERRGRKHVNCSMT